MAEDHEDSRRRNDGDEYCTKSQAMQIARETGHAVVKETFQELGINTADTDHIIQAQVDFAYLRRSRKSAENMQAHAKKLVIGAGIAGMASMLWAALSMKGGS